MVKLYTCGFCERGEHDKCEIGQPAPEGQYGGTKCMCPCGGNPNMNMTDKPQQPISVAPDRPAVSGNDSGCAGQQSREIQGASDHIGDANEMVPSQHPVESAADRLVSVDCITRQANYSVIGQATDTAGSEPSKEAVEALPCPFCGSTVITVECEHCPPMREEDTNRRWFAECCKCSCQGPFCQKEPQVIPAWNKRAIDAATADLRRQFADYVKQTLQDRMERDRAVVERDELKQQIESGQLCHECCGPISGDETGSHVHSACLQELKDRLLDTTRKLDAITKQRDEAIAMLKACAYEYERCGYCGEMFRQHTRDCRLGKLLKEVGG